MLQANWSPALSVCTYAPGLPRCSLCDKAVSLETSETDEYGKAAHDECYALKMCLKQATSPQVYPFRVDAKSPWKQLSFLHNAAEGSALARPSLAFGQKETEKCQRRGLWTTKTCSSLRKINDRRVYVGHGAGTELSKHRGCGDGETSNMLRTVPSENPQPRL